jgi:hypothetical protein
MTAFYIVAVLVIVIGLLIFRFYSPELKGNRLLGCIGIIVAAIFILIGIYILLGLYLSPLE